MPERHLAQVTYDADADILHVTHPTPVDLATPDLIRAYFRDIMEQWRKLTGGRRVYFLVNWTNFQTNLVENATYTEAVREVADEAAIVIVRYTGVPLQRAAGRLVALKLHRPSHIYSSYEEALQTVQGLQRGDITLAPRDR
jgi:hypothetical protein